MEGKYVVIRGDGGFESLPIDGAVKPEVDEATLTRTQVNDLIRDPNTLAIAPDMPMRLIAPVGAQDESASTSEAGGTLTWGVQAVRAHESPFDGEGIIVAVLDTGIDAGHPAFAGVDLVQGNFTDEAGNDLHGHGTHCAGTIFGRDVNGKRIGVAPGVERAVIGKVLGANGGSSGAVARAMVWAAEQGAHVISMSLGIDFPGYVAWLIEEEGLDEEPATSIALEGYRYNILLYSQLMSYLRQFSTRTIVVAASGNESNRPKYEVAVAPPAASNGIMAVGALRSTSAGLQVAGFSNDKVNVSAPGVNVTSARLGGGLVAANGTSMATPHVAGVAALWAHKQVNETGLVDQSVLQAQVLANSTRAPLAAGWVLDDVGQGIVQAPLN